MAEARFTSQLPQEYLADDALDSLTLTVYILPEILFEVYVDMHHIGVPSLQLEQGLQRQLEG
jgi:hypothetical protein